MVTSHRDRDKADEFNAFLASIFITDDGPRGCQCPELEYRDCKNDLLPVDYETAETAAPAPNLTAQKAFGQCAEVYGVTLILCRTRGWAVDDPCGSLPNQHIP